MAKSLLAGDACGKWGVREAEKMPRQILGCPQVLSGRWVGDDRDSSWCQQPGVAEKGSSCQEKLHDLPCHRNLQQKHKVFAEFYCCASWLGRLSISSFFKQLVNN